MNEKFTPGDAAAESAKNYGIYNNAYHERERAIKAGKAADRVATTLFKQLIRNQELVTSGFPTSDGDRQTTQRILQDADAAQARAQREESNEVVAGMNLNGAADRGAQNFAAHPTEYHQAALNEARDAHVKIVR